MRRLLRSARSVIAREGFDGASITAIVEDAGLSIGAFYQRFDSKEALLQELHEETVEHNIALMRRSFEPERWKGKSASSVLEEWIRSSLQISKRDAGFQRACYQRALGDDAFSAREARIRRELAELLTPLLIERLPGRRSRERQARVDFCLTMVTAVVSDVYLAARFAVLASPPSREALAAQLLEACCAHLGIRTRR